MERGCLIGREHERDSTLIGSRIMKNHKKEKIAILAVWFASIVGIRFFLGLILSNIWIGTVGAVAITFAIFYFTLRYTTLSRYSNAVNSAVQSWYSKRYVLFGLLTSMVVLAGLMALAEIGYLYHSDKVISMWELENPDTLDGTRAQLTASLDSLRAQGYSQIDSLAIILASVDKSLDGHYLQAVSFILAEDIEILVFSLLLRKIGQERSIFSSQVAPNKNRGNDNIRDRDSSSPETKR
jgi:hypothetical protein